MGFLRVICSRVIPALIISVAIFLGWIAKSPKALPIVFATLQPILEGRLPPTIVGHGKMEGTPPVPDDMLPQARPEDELFLELPGGYKMPQSGIGMCCRSTAYDDVLVRRTVLWYLLLGGRHIDGADQYLNHKAIGLGIKDAMERGVPREEIFFTTKIPSTYFGYNSTLEIVPTYLEETGLEYIDLVLMHTPSSFPIIPTGCTRAGLSHKQCRRDTWKALSELREKGVMRNVGVSNFAVRHLKDIQELGLAPIANHQFNFNPFVPAKQIEVFDYSISNGISVTGYFSLGGAHERKKAATVETLQRLATKYGVSVPQLMLRWSVQKGAAVIPGTSKPKHMESNLGVYSFEISEEDVAEMDQLKHSKDGSKFIFLDPDTMSSD